MRNKDPKSYTENVFQHSPNQTEIAETAAWRNYRDIYNRAVNGEEFDYPIHLEIENIYACNLKCIHCAREYIEDAGIQRMSNDLYKKVVKEAVAMGTRSLGFAVWGEAFLDKKIFEKIVYARECGILDIRLHSNGYLVTPDIAKKIVESGVTWMSISLDAATPETYARVRGGEFRRAVSGLTNLIEAKLLGLSATPKLRVSFVKCSENEHEAEAFSRHYSQFCDVAIQEFYDANGILPQALKPSVSTFQPKTQCFENFYKAFIRHDGTVVPCCEDIRSSIVLGNLSGQSLYDIYNSPVAKELRNQHASGRISNKTCRVCMGLDPAPSKEVISIKFHQIQPT